MNPGSQAGSSQWRGASTSPAAPTPTAAGPAWRSTAAAAPYRTRWWKLAAVAALLFICLASVSYSLLWLRPPEPARLMIVEAGYETNLTVPPNATGKAASRELLSLTGSGGRWMRSHGRLSGAAEPIRLTRGAGASLLPDLDKVKEKAVVIFLAAHGGRDLEGAFLFPNDTTPNPAHRVRLKAVIDRLAQMPKNKHKVLVLDATQPPSFPDLGIFHNDFAYALEQLEPSIAEVPNLVVVSSTGMDERSWVCPEWGQTVFAHYFIEGLKGPADADHDQRLTAWELFDYLRPRVHDWARDHRAALQTPVLLPRGEEGERRARDIFITTAERHPAAPSTAAPTPFDPPPELEQIWAEYLSLANASPSPLTYAPHLWREYEAWVLRFEQLLLNGTSEAAEEVRAKAADARRRIEAARKLPISPQTIALPFAIGGVSGPKQVPVAVMNGLDRLAETPDADRAKLWAQLRGAIPDRGPDAAKLLWCKGLVEWVAVDPATRLSIAPSLIALVTEGMTVRPSELHLLDMFASNVPAFTKASPVGPLLGNALNLRATAEREAVAGDQYAGYCLPWVKDLVAAGDGARRKAEDLVFASDGEQWKRAATFAADANATYKGVEDRAARISSAVRTWHETTARLPALDTWLTYFPDSEVQAARQAREDELQKARAIWNETHQLAMETTFSVPAPTAALESATESLGFGAADIKKHMQPIEERLGEETERLLKRRPEFDARRETRKELVAWWRSADAVLSAPPSTLR